MTTNKIAQEGKPVSRFSLKLRNREREARHEPFVFDVDGEIFTIRKSPAEVDWQVTAALGKGEGDLRDFMRELLEDDYERFAKLRGIGSDDLNELIEAATRHFEGVGRGE